MALTRQELIEWVKNRAILEESTSTQEKLRLAADTIERLQNEFQAMKEVADERGESFARSIDDFNNMRDQRDAALAEVDRLKAFYKVDDEPCPTCGGVGGGLCTMCA